MAAGTRAASAGESPPISIRRFGFGGWLPLPSDGRPGIRIRTEPHQGALGAGDTNFDPRPPLVPAASKSAALVGWLFPRACALLGAVRDGAGSTRASTGQGRWPEVESGPFRARVRTRYSAAALLKAAPVESPGCRTRPPFEKSWCNARIQRGGFSNL